MRTVEERIARINWLLDKRLERVEQGSTYWNSLPAFSKLKASSRRWGSVELRLSVALADAAIAAADDAVYGANQDWLVDFAKSQRIS